MPLIFYNDVFCHPRCYKNQPGSSREMSIFSTKKATPAAIQEATEPLVLNHYEADYITGVTAQ